MNDDFLFVLLLVIFSISGGFWIGRLYELLKRAEDKPRLKHRSKVGATARKKRRAGDAILEADIIE